MVAAVGARSPHPTTAPPSAGSMLINHAKVCFTNSEGKTMPAALARGPFYEVVSPQPGMPLHETIRAAGCVQMFSHAGHLSVCVAPVCSSRDIALAHLRACYSRWFVNPASYLTIAPHGVASMVILRQSNTASSLGGAALSTSDQRRSCCSITRVLRRAGQGLPAHAGAVPVPGAGDALRQLRRRPAVCPDLDPRVRG